MSLKFEIQKKTLVPDDQIRTERTPEEIKFEQEKFSQNWTEYNMEVRKMLYEDYRITLEQILVKKERQAKRLKDLIFENWKKGSAVATTVCQLRQESM